MTVTNHTRKAPQVNLKGRQVPYDEALELEALGFWLDFWDRLEPGVQALDPLEDFYVPAHQRLAAVLLAGAAEGAVSDALLRRELARDDWALLDIARSQSPISARAGTAVAAALHDLAHKRRLAAEAQKLLDELAPLTAAELVISDHPLNGVNHKAVDGVQQLGGGEAFFAGGRRVFIRDGGVWDGHGNELLPFVPEVLGAWQNGSARFLVRVGPDQFVVSDAELADGTAWFHFPCAGGTANYRCREIAADIVRKRGEAMIERASAPKWVGDELHLPSPEWAEALEIPALAGYRRQAPGADAEPWRLICQESAKVPALALCLGAGLGGLLLQQAGLGHTLDPLGFVVHLYGEGGQGKTTAQKLTAAIFGDPGRIVHTWAGTKIGLGATLAEAGCYPLFLSDTATWAHGPAELAQAVMGALEGWRLVSARNGEAKKRGDKYQSVLVSTGNAAITAGAVGDPIMRRVIEIEAPFTLDSAQAVRLKTAAAAGYGWPLAQAIEHLADYVKVFPTLVRWARGELADLCTEPLLEDVAVRLAVLVAGASVLGSLLDLGDVMGEAAYFGARELLESLQGRRIEDHPSSADGLLAAVWDDYRGQPWAYPSPSANPVEGRETRGWLTPQGRLALRPLTLDAVAARARIADPTPALRELRARGVLYVHGERRLRGELAVGGEIVRGLYIFGRPGEQTRAHTRGPDAPRVSESPSPPAPEAPDTRETPTRAGSDGRVHARGPEETLKSRAVVMALDGASWARLGPDQPPQGGAWAPSAIHHIGDLFAYAEAHGSATVWLAAGALTPMGLPVAIPVVPWGEGVPHHPFITEALRQGWHVTFPSKPGLAPVMNVSRDPDAQVSRSVEVRVPSWHDSNPCQWPDFAKLDGASDLAEQVYALQMALRPNGDRAWRLNYGPLSTFRALVASLQPGHQLAPVPDLPPVVVPELPDWLARPFPTEGYVRMFDRNKSFLAALDSVEISIEAPAPSWSLGRGDFPPGELERPGMGLCVARPEWDGDTLRQGRPDGPLWLPTSLLKIAGAHPASLALLGLSATFTGTPVRYFRPFTERIRAALEALEPFPTARLELKRIYSKGVNQLDQEPTDGRPSRWYRPDWKAQIQGLHVANTGRALNKAAADGARLVGTGLRDSALFVVDEPGAVPVGLKVHHSAMGSWKPKGDAILARQAAVIVAAQADNASAYHSIWSVMAGAV